MTQYNTKLLTMIMEKLFHIPTHGDFLPNNKHKHKNGIKTCYGILDQSNFTDKDLQQVMVNISHLKRVIRLGNKNGTISREREWAMFWPKVKNFQNSLSIQEILLNTLQLIMKLPAMDIWKSYRKYKKVTKLWFKV